MLRFHLLPIPRSHCQRFPFLPSSSLLLLLLLLLLFYFIFLTLGCIADSNASVLDFETSIKVRRLVHAARRHVFRSDFTLKHYTLNSYVFYFPIPLPPRQEHMKQFHSPLSQWQHVVLGITLGGMVTSNIDLHITLFF